MGQGAGGGPLSPTRSKGRLRSPAWVTADAPDYINLRKAGRAAIVAPAVLAIGQYVLRDEAVAVYAFFAAVVGLVFADYGGPPRRRAFGYLTMILAGAALIALGAVLSASVVAAVIGMFVVAFVATFATAFGGYAPLHVSAMALAFSLSVLQPLSDLGVPDRLLGWALGGVAALIAALVLWPVDRRTGLHDAAAHATDQLAATLAARDHPDEAAARLHHAAAAVADLQARLATPLRPYGPAEHDISMVHLIEHLEHCVVAIGDVLDTPPPSDATVDRLVQEVVDALKRSGDLLLGTREVTAETTNLVELDHALAAASARVRDAAASAATDDGTSALDAMVASIPLVALSHLVLWTELDAYRAMAPGPVVTPALQTAPEVSKHGRRDLRAVVGRGFTFALWELDAGGVILKNSIRAGVALATAVALAEVLSIDHGFWIVLATLMVLRSSASSTAISVVAAVLGTGVGFVVAAGIVAVAGDAPVVLWILLPLAVAGAAFTPKIIGVAAGQATFALVVVILFMLVDLPGMPTDVLRIETVAIGAAAGGVLSLIMWPRGARAVLGRALADVYRAAADAAATFVTGSPQARTDAEAEITAAHRKAEAALTLALAEHGEPIDTAAWVTVFQPLDLTRALLLGLVPTVRSANAACDDAVDGARRLATVAGARLAAVATRLDPPSSGGTAGPHDVVADGSNPPRLPGLERCLAACSESEKGMADVLALASWSLFLEQLCDEIVRSDADLAAVARASTPHRWLRGPAGRPSGNDR